jgi:hypothetical protein
VSRSIRKRAFGSWHSGSMKEWRTKENRRLRHNSKQLINNCEDYDALIIPVLNDYDTLWGSPQDGRKFYQETPLLNQCEVDFYNLDYQRWRWIRYKDVNLFQMMYDPNAKYKGEHPNEYCNCYHNKRSSYWKNRRK